MISVLIVASGLPMATGHSTAIIVPSHVQICEDCIAWSECLMDYQKCFSSNMTATFLPGENYILNKHFVIRDVQSLSIRGSKMQQNQPNIDCNYTEGGFGFLNVTDLYIAGITISSCGANRLSLLEKLGTLSLRSFLSVYRSSHTFAVQLVDTFNVHIDNVIVTNSSGYGLLCVNILGNSYIQNSVLTQTNIRRVREHIMGEIDCSENSAVCRGVNAMISFLDTENNCIDEKPIHRLVIEDTEISHGMCLSGAFSGAGLKVDFFQSRYDVEFEIKNCVFHHNVAELGAHISLAALRHATNSSVSITNCTFSSANQLITSNLEKWKHLAVAHWGTVAFAMEGVLKLSPMNKSCVPTAPSNYSTTVTLEGISIEDNIGGGLYVGLAEVPSCCFRVTVRRSEILRNSILHVKPNQGTVSTAIYVGEFRDLRYQRSPLILVLDKVEISNNHPVLFEEAETLWNVVKTVATVYAKNTEIHMTSTELYNNSAVGIYTYRSELHLHGYSQFKNNTGISCGGAISLNQFSIMYVYPGTEVYIVENTAKQYGGGICIDDGKITNDFTSCFYQIVDFQHFLVYKDSTIYLQYNRATETGYSVFGGPTDPCTQFSATEAYLNTPGLLAPESTLGIATSLFRFDFPPNTALYQVSSEPTLMVYCYGETVIKQPDWTVSVESFTVYPGQTVHFWAVAMGSGGIVSGVARARIESDKHMLVQGYHTRDYSIFPELQDVTNSCSLLHYTLLAPENISGIPVLFMVEGQSFYYLMNFTTLRCPQGFIISHSQCVCHPLLRRASVSCDINGELFSRAGTVWIGTASNKGTLSHMHCPNNYCKAQNISFNFSNADSQCAFNHAGVLCGKCRPGLALMLGSSNCGTCSMGYLSLLFIFIALGLLLVIILGKINITVATGTISGFMFYANLVKASSNALTLTATSRYFTIIMAWLNLDFGVEVCFSSQLDMFWKTLIQFLFPLYIWLLVVAIIIASRYSTTAARLSGSNSVPVLATLFLLSYAKVLDTIITVFSFTTIETEKGSDLVVWLHDGNLEFFRGKHIALAFISLLFTICYVIPLTLLLLFAPLLQRVQYWRVVRLVQRIKPLLDAYQGPYKDKFRWWPGLMLIARIVLFVAFTANVKHNPSLDLLFLVLVAFLVIFLGLILSGGVFKNQLLTLLDMALNTNLLVLGVWSLFNHSVYLNEVQLFKHQKITVYLSVTIMYCLLAVVLAYHVFERPRVIGALKLAFVALKNKQCTTNEVEEHELRERQDSTSHHVVRAPTVTVVDLRESLLTD